MVCFGVLLAALSTVFFFGHERGYFYRPHTHNDISAQTMAIATNLAAEHRFLLFYSRFKNDDGTVGYEVYNRYPFGTYLAIRLVSLPFGDDPAAQLWAARLLMLLFYAGAACLAHVALCRITGSPEIALMATLLTFSSFYFLYYADFIATDVAGLFGLMMTFHAMVKFGQEGALRPLCAKTAVAIALDWHVMALVLMFVAFGTVAALFDRRSRLAARPALVVALWRNRHLRYGAFAASVCTTVMALQLANEYVAFGGRTPFLSLPTIESYQQRLLFDEMYLVDYDNTRWGTFLSDQFQRLSGLALPYVAALSLDVVWLNWDRCCHGIWQRHDYGAAFLFLSCIGVFFGPAKHRLAMATLIAGGVCWTLVMRGSTAFHDFEVLFMVGVPLVFYAALGVLVRMIPRSTSVLLGLALTSAAVFASSAHAMGKVGRFTEDPFGVVRSGYDFHHLTMPDVASIRGLTPEGSTICVADGLKGHIRTHRDSVVKFFFARRVVTLAYSCADRGDDYLISLDRMDANPALLTPNNALIFLYARVAVLDESGPPGLVAATAAAGPSNREHLGGETYTTQYVFGGPVVPSRFIKSWAADAHVNNVAAYVNDHYNTVQSVLVELDPPGSIQRRHLIGPLSRYTLIFRFGDVFFTAAFGEDDWEPYVIQAADIPAGLRAKLLAGARAAKAGESGEAMRFAIVDTKDWEHGEEWIEAWPQ